MTLVPHVPHRAVHGRKERIGKGVVVSTTYKKYKGKISVICILQISFTLK